MSQAAEYQRAEERFDHVGLDLSCPPDAPAQPRRLVTAINVQRNGRNQLIQRAGTSSVLTAPANRTPFHSIRRLNNAAGSDFTYVAGIGPGASTGKTGVMIERAVGFSGNPLTLLPFTPESANEAWMAVADSNKLAKVALDGTVHQLGLPQPTAEPFAEFDWLTGPLRIDVDTGANAAGWTGGAAGANYINTAFVRSAYAGNDPTLGLGFGWFVVQLASLAAIGVGVVLTDSVSGSHLLVEEIHPPSPSIACTIKQIIFDNGTPSGWATIVPTVAFKEFEQHALVKFDGSAHAGTTQYAALTHVITGPDGTVALRCYLFNNGTVAGDTLSVQSSVYGYADGLFSGNLQAAQTFWGPLPASTMSLLVRSGLALNLSAYATGGKSVDRRNDEMHIALFVSDLSHVDAFRIEADVDDGTFTKNFYGHDIRPSDLLPLTLGGLSPIDRRTTSVRNRNLDGSFRTPIDPIRAPGDDTPRGPRDGNDPDVPLPGAPPGPVVDVPGSSSSQTGTGQNQWHQIRFKMSDFQRGGTDDSKDLQLVNALRLVVVANAVGTVNVAINSWWIGGGYEPDIAEGAPYEYEIRYRSSLTGARSNWSPPSRSYVFPHRYQVRVSFTNSAVAECDKVDVRRRGGTINSWVIVGTADNGSGTFFDIYSDEYALGESSNAKALEGNVNAQPFTDIDKSFVATVAQIAGVMVRHGANGFNTAWAQGTPVIANGVGTFIYRVHSADVMQLYDNVGSGANLKLEIPEPHVTGRPMPIIFGPVDGYYFALGSSINGGRLYIFNNGTLDSTQSSWYADITDSAEPLMSGCVHNDRGYVWSSRRMFRIVPALDTDARVQVAEVAGAPGLMFRWALGNGDEMYWRANDGIYASDGARVECITRELRPLFGDPVSGLPGADAYGVAAPDDSASSAAVHRLDYCTDKMVRYTYHGARTSANFTLRLDRSDPSGEWGWFQDHYSWGGVFHYDDSVGFRQPADAIGTPRILIGSDTGMTTACYAFDSSTSLDAGLNVSGSIRTFANPQGDFEAEKRYGDGITDIDPGNATITPTILLDNFGTSVIGTNVSGSGRALSAPIELDRYAHNIALDLSWTITAANQRPIFYGWGYSWLVRPRDIVDRPSDFSDCGHWGPKEMRGYNVEVDTKNVPKSLTLEYTKEDGTLAAVASSVNAIAKNIVSIALVPPVIGYEFRVRSTDAVPVKFFTVEKWHFDPLTDATRMLSAYQQFQDPQWVQGVDLEADTLNAIVDIDVQREFAEVIRTIAPVQHAGRGIRSYSFDPPFIAFMLRTAPKANARILSTHWLTRPEARLAQSWETLEIELGQPYGTCQKIEVEYASTLAVRMRMYIDGVPAFDDSAQLAATTSTEAFRRKRLMLPPVKGRLAKFVFSCAAPGCRIRWRGTQVWIVHPDRDPQWHPVLGGTHEAGADA